MLTLFTVKNTRPAHVHCYVTVIYSLAKHYRRSLDLLRSEDIQYWVYHLIVERKQALRNRQLQEIPRPENQLGPLRLRCHTRTGRSGPEVLLASF
jgi:hypothetical protein